jgi:peroxiredoxin-like protein
MKTMDALPHFYTVHSRADAQSAVQTAADGKPVLTNAPPAQFGGPGDAWSPEDLLVAAVASCFILTFRAIARASGLAWNELACSAEGTLDKADGATRFTGMALNAQLTVPAGVSADKAERLLHKAEAGCLVSRSLNTEARLQTQIVQAPASSAE